MRVLQKNNSQHFVLFITLLYLTGNTEQSIELLATNKDSFILKNLKPLEVNEVHLMHVFMLMKSRNFVEAIKVLNENDTAILDR
mgnify:CR=1 FL=1